MERVTSIYEGVKKLLTHRGRQVPDFTLEKGEFGDILIWNGCAIPLFPSRYEPRIRALANYGNPPEENSALNVYSFVGRDIPLERLIYREMDIAEYVLHDKVKKITAVVNKNAVNIIAVMENGTCANMDLGNTMTPGSHNQSQHRLITTRGMANDLGVTDMTVQHQVYVYAENGMSVYDDDEYYLYGLDEDEVAKTLTVHAILTGQINWEGFAEQDQHCRSLVAAVYESEKQGKPVYLD